MCRPGIWAEIIAIVSVEPLPGLWLRLFLISRKYRKNEGLVRYFSKAHAQDWDNLPECVQIADAPPWEGWPGEGEGDTGDTAPRDLEPK